MLLRAVAGVPWLMLLMVVEVMLLVLVLVLVLLVLLRVLLLVLLFPPQQAPALRPPPRPSCFCSPCSLSLASALCAVSPGPASAWKAGHRRWHRHAH